MEELEALPVAAEPGTDGRRRRSAVPAAAGVVAAAAAAGVVLTVLVLDRSASAPPGGSGFVWSCQHTTTAVVRFDGLDPDAVVEVHVDLRGDIALLPLTGDQVEVTAGRPVGHQRFRPAAGELALLVPLLARPPHRARLLDTADGSVLMDVRLPVLSC